MSKQNASLDLKSPAQSEREFIMALKSSVLEPESVNLNQLWQIIEPLLQQLPDLEQLRVGGTVMTLLAEIHSAKADRFLADWEERYNDEGPVMEEDLLAGLVQRTMFLDISDLISPKTKGSSKPPADSVAKPVEKKQVLKMLDQMEAEHTTKQQALSVAHDENVSAWIEAIAQWLRYPPAGDPDQGVWFSELAVAFSQEAQLLSPIQIFLALLLGGYQLKQPGGFYSDIWVQMPSG
jgi:hypothetical protein